MSLAHFYTGASAFLIVCLMGAAWAAPTTPSSEYQFNIDPDSQANNGLPEVKATIENQSSESAATSLGVELASEFPEDVKCRSAWQKFLVDFDVHYASDSESQKRQKIFCANWQRIQDHNAQYELGKVSHKKSINQWSDLTFEEWKKQQEPSFPPNLEAAGTYIPELEKGNSTVEEPSPIEELEKQHPAAFTPNMDVPENQTEATEVKGDSPGSQQYWFSPNMEEPGTYVPEPTMTSKSLDEELINGVRRTEDKEEPPNLEIPGNKTDESEIDQKRIECQAAWEKFLTDFGSKYENETETENRRNIFCGNWQRIQDHNAQYELGKVTHKKSINQWADLTFEEWKKLQETSFPPNTEEPGTYLPQPPIEPKEFKDESASSPNLKLLGNETEVKEVNEQDMNSGFKEWLKQQQEQYKFPPNMEEPGTYVPEPRTKSTSSEEESTSEVRRNEDKEKPPNMELPGNKTEETTDEIKIFEG